MIIDGGNAHFADTRRREAALREQGLHFVGMGVSGGEEGALQRPVASCPAARRSPTTSLGPMLETITAKVDGEPCVHPHRPRRRRALRQDGAQRHRVRRHAAHRRGLRPAARTSPATPRPRSPRSSALEHGPARLLPDRDHRRGARPHRRRDRQAASSTSSQDAAGQKGTGRWTVQTALDLASRSPPSPRPSSPASLSGQRDLRAAPRGPARARDATAQPPRPRRFADGRAGAVRLEDRRLRPGLEDDPGRQPTSTAGRSTSARSPRSGAAAASSAPPSSTASAPPTPPTPTWSSLLADDRLRRGDRRRPGRLAARSSPPPSARASRSRPSPPRSPTTTRLRAERLPAALIQGQRDYFGAHTYRRTDRDGAFHTLWGGDRSEVSAVDTH